MTKADLRKIREVAQKACDSAKRMRNGRFKGEAVNWADFGVTEVKNAVYVQVEEASPQDANKVRLYIWDKLKEAGFDIRDIEVVLEW